MKRNDVFQSDYLKVSDLQGKAVRLTIEDVTMEKIGDDTKAVLHFAGKDKTLVLNKTNWNRLEEVCRSDDSDDWHGWAVTIYPTKVDYQGKRVDAIRIDDRPGSAVPPASRGRASAPPPVEDEPMPGAITYDDIPF